MNTIGDYGRLNIDFLKNELYNKNQEVRGMKSIVVTLRVDEDLKKQADSLFNDLGMSLSTAFNVFLKQSVREQQIPFLISRNVPNATTQAAMEAAENDEEMFGPFDSIEALKEALNA